MKNLIVGISSLLFFLDSIGQSVPTYKRESIPFPKDSALLNIKDSILIGKYFVAVRGLFYDNHIPNFPNNAKVFVKGYEDSKTISLKDLKQNFKLLSSDSARPVLNGDIALLKTKDILKSTSFNVNVYDLKKIPKIEILEEGDIIAFVGMVSHDRKGTYTFPATWYKITK